MHPLTAAAAAMIGLILGYIGLFSSAFLAATILPFSSEAVLAGLTAAGGYDLVLFPVFLFGLSVRMSDNRMKEGLFNAPISAFSWGLFMNSATGNQATHCLLVRKAVLPDRTIKDHNIVFIDPTGKGFCEAFRVLEGD